MNSMPIHKVVKDALEEDNMTVVQTEKITHELGTPSGGVEPSYKQCFPWEQCLRFIIAKGSAMSCKSHYVYSRKRLPLK